MPLSWLPLAADYTRQARRPFAATPDGNARLYADGLLDVCLGFGSGVVHRRNRRGKILLGAGLGAAGILAVVLSTVTTTLLDAYSGLAASANNISAKLSETPIAVAVAVVGTLLAVLLPVTEYETSCCLSARICADGGGFDCRLFRLENGVRRLKRLTLAGLVLVAGGLHPTASCSRPAGKAASV